MGTHDDRFAAIYDAWFDEVVKWIGALGMPDSEAEDLAQEVFLVVNRKLSTFDGGNEAGWLYRITELTVRDHRRRAWFRNLFRRQRQDVDIEQVAHVDGIPALERELEQDRVVLQRILAKLPPKLRATFVLFEIEGRSGEEIAAIQDIPRPTVWTRLHNARKVFWKLVAELRRQEGETK
jgi:RNA polymerase sigma-70 factor, ECF subfamily